MRFEDGNIVLSEDFEDNYIQIDQEDFYLSYLNPGIPSNKGASSNVFILHDPNDDLEDRVIKICKTPFVNRSRNKRIRRFEREIQAYQIAKRNNCSNVVKFYRSGKTEISGYLFLYIILEKAQGDLASYLESNKFRFTPNQKLSFCISILSGIKQLHDVKIYHRDIKHDNILLVNGEFKIGDLGLVSFQDQDFDIDSVNEKIGPIGWLSPEATNKMLSENKIGGYDFDCRINSKSDIFQLGKLFWYIFQGNLPVGQITIEDSLFANKEFYEVLFLMLQHRKDSRPDMSRIFELFEPIKVKLAV